MPILRNPKHERFAQLVSKGVTQTEAAKTVGYSELRAAVTGSNLAKNRKVSARIAELSVRVVDQIVSATAIDRAWVLEGLKRIASEAEAENDFNPAIKAHELIGKELGMFVDRKEVRLGKPLSEMTYDELTALVADGAGADRPSESIN